MISTSRFSSLALQRYFSSATLGPQKQVSHLKGLPKALETLQSVIKLDPYKGALIDFTALSVQETSKLTELKKALLKISKIYKKKGIHVLGISATTDNSRVIKAAIDCGFKFHNANSEKALLNKCLHGHRVKECTFPEYRTLSAGLTCAVFFEDKVLLVREKLGLIKKDKPITGIIDYGTNGDSPQQACVREVLEETGLSIAPEDVKLVAVSWSNDYRGNAPDTAYIFAVKLKEMQKITAQETEISKAEWVYVNDFLQPLPEEAGKPWQLREAVRAAWKAMEDQNAWTKKTVFLTTGKPAEFYSMLKE